MAELSRAPNFDPSYVSRIRLGKRQPADAPAFAQGVGRFVTRRFASCAVRTELAEILNLPVEALAEDDACAGCCGCCSEEDFAPAEESVEESDDKDKPEA